jgi:hypothetical protein
MRRGADAVRRSGEVQSPPDRDQHCRQYERVTPSDERDERGPGVNLGARWTTRACREIGDEVRSRAVLAARPLPSKRPQGQTQKTRSPQESVMLWNGRDILG